MAITARKQIFITDISDKDFVCAGGQLRVKTGSFVNDETGGDAPVVGAAPDNPPTNPADGAIVVELFDNLERYWSFSAASGTYSHIEDRFYFLTFSDSSNTFDLAIGEELETASSDDSIEVDASGGTYDINLKVVYGQLLHTGAADVVSSGVSDDFYTIPVGLNGWELDAVTFKQVGGIGEQNCRLTYDGANVGAVQSLSGDSNASEDGIGESVVTGGVVRITTSVTSGSPEGLAATFMFKKP